MELIAGGLDMAYRGMDFISSFWDSASGGSYLSATERGASIMRDLWVSGGGQAALYTGRRGVAICVGRWMKLVNLAPNYPQQLFSRTGGLHTAFESSDEVRCVLNANTTRDEYFFHPGIELLQASWPTQYTVRQLENRSG